MDPKLDTIKAITTKHQRDRSALIMVLQDIHTEYNYLPEGSLEIVARELDVPLSAVFGVATFFKSFSFKPRGRHVASVCLGTACHVRGGTPVAAEFERLLGIKAGETTNDGQFSLETVNCLGCCAIGPVVVVDGKYHGQVSVQDVEALIAEHKVR
jgi:NADH:ubiquinone oxidoreductase subunit E